MTAAWCNLMRGTSTILRRSSEVRCEASRLPGVVTLTALFMLLARRETLLNVLCGVSLVTATILLPTGLQTELPLTVLMVLVCACVRACVYSSCVFSLAHLVCGGENHPCCWFVGKHHFLKQLSKQKAWDAYIFEWAIISFNTGRRSHDPPISSLYLRGETWFTTVQRINVCKKVFKHMSQIYTIYFLDSVVSSFWLQLYLLQISWVFAL